MTFAVSFAVFVLSALPVPRELPVQSPQDLVDKAELDFTNNRIAESVGDYDRLVVMVPSIAPVLWQRGIGLYELGRFKECAAQFAAHATVEPLDMENAAWHFFCVARGETPARARTTILRSGRDRRIMRSEIYDMLLGTMTPAEVIDAAGGDQTAQFYAHLYTGLYLEVTGDQTRAREHLTLAADPRYDGLAGFMNVVARVHLKRLQDSSGRAGMSAR
jgi:lipoprotein NlpI